VTSLRFVTTPLAKITGAPLTKHIVLDEAWSGDPGRAGAPIAVSAAQAAAIERADFFDEALRRMDAWAAAADAVDALTVDGVAWWFRLRESLVNWLHERLLWRAILVELAEGDNITSLEVPESNQALVDVAMGLADAVRVDVIPDEAQARTTSVPAMPVRAIGGRSLFRRLLRAGPPAAPDGRSEGAADRESVLDERVRRLSAGRPKVMVLSHTGIHEWSQGPGGRRRFDPLLGPVIDRLRERGQPPIVVGLGLDHHDADQWRAVAADDNLLPGSLLRARWRSTAEAAATVLDPALASLGAAQHARLEVDGSDLAAAFLAEIGRLMRSVVLTSIRQIPRVERLIDEIRPQGILLTHEGIRTPWLVAARRRSVPTWALQHGVLYRTHPGYQHPRCHAWALPDRTFVYGPYERRVLLDVGGYLPDEVEISGSPRSGQSVQVDMPPANHVAERAAIRRELGVAEGDRLLVISTTFSGLGRTYLLHMLGVLLDGPLPRVHLLFKQHPGEHDDGPYRALVEGLARVGGWAPPPISVVRGEDLLRMLQAADAHLGLYSTVLTDAVAAGTPNLLAVVSPKHDVLGYVEAGVARPVRSVVELRNELDHPAPIDPSARRAFLDDHFRRGDAAGRLANALLEIDRATAEKRL
jgi:hypothetical protein